MVPHHNVGNVPCMSANCAHDHHSWSIQSQKSFVFLLLCRSSVQFDFVFQKVAATLAHHEDTKIERNFLSYYHCFSSPCCVKGRMLP